MTEEEKKTNAAATDGDKKKKKGDGESRKLIPKPDNGQLEKEISTQNAVIETAEKRLDEIKAQLLKKEQERQASNSESQSVRDKLAECREATRAKIAERREIYDQIGAIDKTHSHLAADAKKMRGDLKFFTVEEIDAAIREKEFLMATSTMTLRAEKDIMADIQKLVNSKQIVKDYAETVDQSKKEKLEIDTLYDAAKMKNAEVNVLRDAEKEQMALLAAFSEKYKSTIDVPALRKEQKEIYGTIKEARMTIRGARDTFKKKNDEYYNQQREIRKERQEEQKKRWAEYQEERKAWADAKAKEEEENRPEPWLEEKQICDQLVTYLENAIGANKKTTKATVEKKINLESGMKAIGKGCTEEDVFFMGGGGKKKGKGGGKKKEKAAAPTNFKHSLDAFSNFSTVGITLPITLDKFEETIKELKAKRAWYETAPPPEKKKKEPKAAPSQKKTFDNAVQDDDKLVSVDIQPVSGTAVSVAISINEAQPEAAPAAPAADDDDDLL